MKFGQLIEGFTDKALARKEVLEQIKKIMSRSRLCPKESIFMSFDGASFDFEEEDPRGEHVFSSC